MVLEEMEDQYGERRYMEEREMGKSKFKFWNLYH